MTNEMTRRALLLGTTALVGCSSINQAVPVWVAALQAVGEEFQLVMPQLQGAGLSGANAAVATTVIQNAEKALAVIDATSTQTQGQSTLITVEQYINALAPLVIPFASLIPGGAAIGLIVAALPAIELAVNLGASLLSTQAQALAASAPKVASAVYGRASAPLTAQQALDILLAKHNLQHLR